MIPRRGFLATAIGALLAPLGWLKKAEPVRFKGVEFKMHKSFPDPCPNRPYGIPYLIVKNKP